MADPRQKSLELPNYLNRYIPFWGTPSWMEADRWRRVVRSQPIALICRDHLITYLQALPWEIRPRNPKEILDEDVAYYTNYVLADFDGLVDKLWQDALDLPIGGNVETVRWPAGVLPSVEYNGETYKCTKQWSKGHVFEIVNLDGATVYPTFDKQFPLAQKVMEDINTVVYFKQEEIARILLTPRPEMRMKGYSMPPPERIYLALTLLFRGDQYYANLLLDTPEAGVLDLVDMQQRDAKEWVASFRSMFENTIDPLKIGVLYEHKTPATWIPFGRPPTDMMFDSVTMKYARILAAGYWLTLGNIGLEAKGDTLSGSIREDQQVMKTGYGVIKEKTKNFLDNIIPPYLEWQPKEISYETLTGKGRAFLVYAQALKAAKDTGALKPSEVQAQLVTEGFITVDVELPDDKELAEAAQAPQFGGNQLAGNNAAKQIADKTPPAEGGRGDVTGKAGVRKDLSKDIKFPAPKDAQLLRLIKAATKLLYPTINKAFFLLSDNELPEWLGERVMMRFGQPSAYDDLPDIAKADSDKLDELDKALNGDKWWELPESLKLELDPVYRSAFTAGAIEAAELVQEFLYTEGLRGTASLGVSFELTNPATLSQLETKAATLIKQLDDGTRYYLKRILASSVEEGLASPAIAAMIREGASVTDILKQGDFTEGVIERVKAELANLQPSRIESIVNTEINRAESMGRLEQWSKMGLQRKGWQTFGAACDICKRNEAQGLVEMSYVFEDVFSGTLTPPAHPQICRCNLKFDEQELISRAGELKAWDGS